MKASTLVAGLTLSLAIPVAQADCPFHFQAVPRKVVVITSSTDELPKQCHNIYEALSKDNPCELDMESRQNIAREFYLASVEFRNNLNLDECRGTGPKTSRLMSCLVGSADEYAFTNCMGLKN
jgi:hypothetical protein